VSSDKKKDNEGHGGRISHNARQPFGEDSPKRQRDGRERQNSQGYGNQFHGVAAARDMEPNGRKARRESSTSWRAL
jgi:hypothetical protein